MSHPLLAGLANEDRDERARACRACAGDPAAVLLVDALGERLGDPDEGVAWAASEALAHIGSQHREVEGLLRRAQHGEVPRARLFVTFARARLGHRDVGLLPPLVEAWASGAGPSYWRAGQIAVSLDAAIPELRPLLGALVSEDPREGVRRMAAHCLRRLRAGDAPAAQKSR